MIENCVIIGGGVAGLSASNRLADRGLPPLVIEGGQYPSQKICGEFFSYECLSILDQWNIRLPYSIHLGRFFRDETQIDFQLPSCGSCSRFVFDSLLLERAKRKGVRFMTGTTVQSLVLLPSKNFELQLSTGQNILAQNLIIGTGKIPSINASNSPSRYVGFKAHFKNITPNRAVEMYSFPGGYLGLSNVDSEITNMACLIQKNRFSNFDSPDSFLGNLFEDRRMEALKKRLSRAEMVFPNWLIGQLPEFGIRKNPFLEKVFWIGDAAGSIPPISGEGLAIAITSGYIAGDYLFQSTAQEFKNAWLKRYRKRFLVTQKIHRLMMSPNLSRWAFKAVKRWPEILRYFWKETRD